MTRRALKLLDSKRNDAYEAALAALREDTQAWWADMLARDPDEMEAGEEPATADVVFSYPVVRVESAPARVYERPHVYYRGRDAYLVNGRWYYPTDRGWVYFREEPTELRRYR